MQLAFNKWWPSWRHLKIALYEKKSESRLSISVDRENREKKGTFSIESSDDELRSWQDLKKKSESVLRGSCQLSAESLEEPEKKYIELSTIQSIRAQPSPLNSAVRWIQWKWRWTTRWTISKIGGRQISRWVFCRTKNYFCPVKVVKEHLFHRTHPRGFRSLFSSCLSQIHARCRSESSPKKMRKSPYRPHATVWHFYQQNTTPFHDVHFPPPNSLSHSFSDDSVRHRVFFLFLY